MKYRLSTRFVCWLGGLLTKMTNKVWKTGNRMLAKDIKILYRWITYDGMYQAYFYERKDE